ECLTTLLICRRSEHNFLGYMHSVVSIIAIHTPTVRSYFLGFSHSMVSPTTARPMRFTHRYQYAVPPRLFSAASQTIKYGAHSGFFCFLLLMLGCTNQYDITPI